MLQATHVYCFSAGSFSNLILRALSITMFISFVLSFKTVLLSPIPKQKR